MFLIAHRGNINGKVPELENSPDYINAAISNGYDVEVDVWFQDDEFYLGHDFPQYKTSVEYLRNDKLWCHCKNIEALAGLVDKGVHCFFHKSDDVILTSKNYLWVLPRKKLVKDSVCVLPELGYKGTLGLCSGICSDYIERYR